MANVSFKDKYNSLLDYMNKVEKASEQIVPKNTKQLDDYQVTFNAITRLLSNMIQIAREKANYEMTDEEIEYGFKD